MASKQLNKNNFLRWFGEFEEVAIENIAVDDTSTGPINADTINILPLANDTSIIGIDVNSFIFTQQVYVDSPAVWNPITKQVTFYTKDDSIPGDYDLKYKWKDLQGNYSNEGTITITLTERETAWRGLAISYACQLDGDGHNTGYGFYSTLEQYYTGTDIAVDPANQKPNDPDDPDYIAPALDSYACSAITYKLLDMYHSVNSSSDACANLPGLDNHRVVYIRPIDDPSNVGRGMEIGCIFYTDTALTTPVDEGGWFAISGVSYGVNGAGVVYNKTFCS